MSEVMMDDFVQEDHSEQKGKVTVRTRVIDVDRDKNNFISEIHSFASMLESKIRDKIIEAGEAENDSDVHVRVVLTLGLPSTARSFPNGLEAFKNLSMRTAVRTRRANVTVVLSRENYVREKEDEIKQKLTVISVPFKDAKCVMEARIDNGAVLLQFKPISSLSSESHITILKHSGWSWGQVMDHIAERVGDEFRKQMQVYDLVCVFRNIAFESTAEVIAE